MKSLVTFTFVFHRISPYLHHFPSANLSEFYLSFPFSLPFFPLSSISKKEFNRGNILFSGAIREHRFFLPSQVSSSSLKVSEIFKSNVDFSTISYPLSSNCYPRVPLKVSSILIILYSNIIHRPTCFPSLISYPKYPRNN